MLKDVDLGPFENMRFQLSGAKGFTQAYKVLKLQARKEESENAALAAKIIDTIDAKLAEKLEKIDQITKDKPEKILTELKKFSFKFRGAPAADIAKQKYEKLKNDMDKKSESENLGEDSK